MNFIITALFGITAGAVCLYFWIKESRPFVEAYKNLSGNPFMKGIKTIGILPMLFPFFLDLGITMVFQVVFSMGAGLAGGVIALWISNIFSMYLNKQIEG